MTIHFYQELNYTTYLVVYQSYRFALIDKMTKVVKKKKSLHSFVLVQFSPISSDDLEGVNSDVRKKCAKTLCSLQGVRLHATLTWLLTCTTNLHCQGGGCSAGGGRIRHVCATPHRPPRAAIGQHSAISIDKIGCSSLPFLHQERKDENTGRGTIYSYAKTTHLCKAAAAE